MKTPPYAVVMAGGRGTRFWPLSRARRPKQLLSLLSAKTLVRETVDRILPVFGVENILVVTVAEHCSAVRDELSFLPARNFLSEPKGNNTAPCIGLAALEIERRQPGSVMAILPADHWIATPASFRRTLRDACRFSTRNPELLVTVGIKPRYPETGFGYILKGPALKANTRTGAYQVTRFKEKPALAAARRIIKAGGLWNSGIFVWPSATILELLGKFNAKIARQLDAMARTVQRTSLTTRNRKIRAVLEQCYGRMPNISIDYAVLEPAAREGRVVTMAADFSWNDIGSWSALHRLSEHDAQGHGGRGRWLSVDSRDCLIFGDDRLLVLLGVEGLAVIDTPDAVLVADLERSQELREVVSSLARRAATRRLLQ